MSGTGLDAVDGGLTEERSRKVAIALLAVIAVVLVGWALKATYFVTMPLAFAFFLALLVHPLQLWLAERLPDRLRLLSLVLPMLLILGVLALALAALWFSIQIVVADLPPYVDKLQQQWASLGGWARQHGLTLPRSAGEAGALGDQAAALAAAAVGSIWSLLAMVVLIFFLVLLMLLEAAKWGRKLRTALPDGQSETWYDTVGVIAHRLRQYLWVRTMVSAVSGVTEGLWLWFVGVDFALFWGLLAFLFNYVPNIGSIIALIPPVLLAFVQFGIGGALLAMAGLVALEQVIGNYIDPRLQGRTLDLSPLVVLMSVIFWGWVWGIAGTLLAVPLTVTIIIICAHVPALEPFALMLSGTSSEQALRRKPEGHM